MRNRYVKLFALLALLVPAHMGAMSQDEVDALYITTASGETMYPLSTIGRLAFDTSVGIIIEFNDGTEPVTISYEELGADNRLGNTSIVIPVVSDGEVPGVSVGEGTLMISGLTGNGTLFLFDTSGKELERKRISPSDCSLSTRAYPKGVYVVGVMTPVGAFSTKIVL